MTDKPKTVPAWTKEAARDIMNFLQGIDWSASSYFWKRDRVAEIVARHAKHDDPKCTDCGCKRDRHEEEPPYPCYADTCTVNYPHYHGDYAEIVRVVEGRKG